jgi:aminoglycoside phosphotransferase (APT) family kinase protein
MPWRNRGVIARMSQVPIESRPELRTPESTVPQDWARLSAYLSSQGLHLARDEEPRQFAGGLANLNYLLNLDGREAVLRRPPLGTLPPGAYDMGREFLILQGLNRGFDLAPHALHLCRDPAILGAPFQIIEYRRGTAVRGALPPSLAALDGIGERLADVMLEALTRLHNLDPAAVNLGGLGRPEGFLERTSEGWCKRARLSADGRESSPCHALIDEIATWLRHNRLPDASASLIHNDMKLDNILLDTSTLTPIALLDWDQCTRGDSLFDLATTLSYYSESTDPPVMQELRQMPTTGHGFPSRQEFAARYAQRMGRDLSDFRFYRVLALFKLAVIFQQLHQRYRNGATQDPRYAGFGSLTDGILEFTLSVARGHVF